MPSAPATPHNDTPLQNGFSNSAARNFMPPTKTTFPSRFHLHLHQNQDPLDPTFVVARRNQLNIILMKTLLVRWRFCCVLMLLIFCHPLSGGEEILLDDAKLLKELRDSFIDKKEAFSSWFDPETSPCKWAGIECEDLSVSQINLSCSSASTLNLPFPRLIGEFKSLKHLNLSRCAFTGEIFPELWDLENLEILDLSNNRLSGAVSASIAKLKHLRQLVLDDNTFDGSFPSSISQLTDLRELSLRSNSFSGDFPKEVGTLQLLQSLDISRNIFSGNLPQSLANLTCLLYFSAAQNRFSGQLLPEIGKLSKLRTLDLSWNSFSGTIPSGIGNLKDLKELNLESGGFTGNIPKQVSKLSNLTYLNLAKNGFDGGLPSTIGKLFNLVYLVASGSGLTGPIPPELGNCVKLRTIDLSFNLLDSELPESLAGLEFIHSIILNTNHISGPVPIWISNWKRVRSITISQNMFSGPLPSLSLPLLSLLDASANSLSGELPAEICINAPSLTTLLLSRNNFSGNIDATFKDCRNLVDLILSENDISGELPGYLGKLQLVNLELSMNKFSGMIPDQLWDSKSLLAISLSNNSLEGMLSSDVANISTLQRLQLDNNLLGGGIPSTIGKLRNLTNLSLHGNKLTGDIPSEIFECSNLVSVDLGGNRLTGQISKSISKWKLLDNLVLSDNKLSGRIPEEICSGFQMVPLPDSEFVQHYGLLDLSRNELEGPIPPTIKHCIVAKDIIFHGNKLNGSIPEEIASLPHLISLDLSFNSLSGSLFSESFSMMNLQGLMLSHNRLQGLIPDNIWSSLPSLIKLDLSNNYLRGQIPPSLFSSKSLIYLDVSDNFLSGDLSVDLKTSSPLLFLNASNNRLNGELEDYSVSSFASLSVLDLHSNKLNGSVPASLSSLVALTYLDISNNNFHDSFPCSICTIQGLAFSNFSGNNFTGQFSSSCFDQKPCVNVPDSPPSATLSHAELFGIAAVAVVIFLLMIVGILLKWNARKVETIGNGKGENELTSSDGLLLKKAKEPPSINIATFEHSLLRINATDISTATENFSKSYIIGDGGFGTVYKAAMPGGPTIAVKRFRGSHLHGEQREFLAEIETIGKVKHENLVPLLGYCVFTDERFLIYEYMENGSLDSWLKRQALDWPTRFKICLGSARGIAFLHYGFIPHIIHRDIKSSNILLDRELEARVSDFGLARIISACESHVSTLVAGTFGYIPPEYGQTMVATAKGDVYSFGVVMMEVVTGRAPTGQSDGEGGNLVGWVRKMVGNGREGEVLFENSGVWKEEMLRVLGIARACTRDEPWKRPDMSEVVKMLKEVRER